MDLPDRLADDLHGAFPALVEEYGGTVYSLALRLDGAAGAEDVAQETFVRAFVALESYEADRIRALALRQWVVTIALNVLRNRRRQAGRHPLVELSDRVGAGDGPVEVDLRTTLSASLLALSLPVRQAVVLRYLLGFDTAETAAILDRPTGTVKAQVSRGLRTLRRVLEHDGPFSQEHP